MPQLLRLLILPSFCILLFLSAIGARQSPADERAAPTDAPTHRATGYVYELPSVPGSTQRLHHLPASSVQPPMLSMPQDGAADLWYEPETLIGQLNVLRGNTWSSRWATEVLQQIRALGPAMASGVERATPVLDRLAALQREAPGLAAKVSDPTTARSWREIGYALGRRLELWRQVARIGVRDASDLVMPTLDPKRLASCLDGIEAATDDSAEGRAWRNYLLVDALRQCAQRQSARHDRPSRELAAAALARLTQTPLTPPQQRFIASAPVAALRAELVFWAAEPVSVADALQAVERYERTRQPADARRLASAYQSLAVSPVEARRGLAECIDIHYRNANMRWSVAGALLNRLIPEPKLEYGKVNDRMVGRPTRGESVMATEISLQTLPDPRRVRLALVVNGEIAAQTATDAGPATFYNESESRYVARKPLEIDLRGIHVWPAEVDVENWTQLNDVETPFDSVPLIGALAQSVAKSQHNQKLPAAREEMRQKIVAAASERIDTEAHQWLVGVVDRLNQQVFDPLNALALDPQLIAAETTEHRLTMRLLLGGDDQLGSYTPRPQAPADSLASVQIHESVINNGIQRLQLDGRTFTMPELSAHVAARLGRPKPWPVNPDNEDVKITFAPRNAVVIHCRDNRVTITLAIAHLSKRRRGWNNFQVRAVYRTQIDGRLAQLVRSEELELTDLRDGAPIPFRLYVPLHGIFSHVFLKNTPWPLIPDSIVRQPKLQDTAITQFVVNDGWVGLALGPKPAPAATARRPRTPSRQ
jgi:hypothetical protein